MLDSEGDGRFGIEVGNNQGVANSTRFDVCLIQNQGEPHPLPSKMIEGFDSTDYRVSKSGGDDSFDIEIGHGASQGVGE